MFNLFRSREKSVRIVLGVILGLVAISMLGYLVPNYGTGTAPETVIATVGNQDITVAEVKNLIQQAIKGRQMPPEILPNYIPHMVDQMIADRALEYEAGRLGFQVTDQDVASAIRQILPAEFFPNGKFAGKEQYAMFLAQHQMTIVDFEADTRRRIMISRLRDVALEGSIVSELEIAETFKVRNEKIEIQYVKLVSDTYRKEVEPTLDEMKAYFTPNAGRYQVPAKRNLAVLLLDQAKLEQSLTPPDSDLQAMYHQNTEQFRVPERVKVRHILLKTEGKPASDEPKIKAQAEDILKQVRGGAKFGDLVDKFSEDPGSKSGAPNREPGLEPGEYWVEKNGQMVKEFETAAFTLKPGQSDVIKTSYGYHVFQVVEHQDGHLKTFEEVKADLAKQWKTQRVTAIMQNASDKAEVGLRADPAHPEKVAAELNMQLIVADGYVTGKPVPEIGVHPDFERSVEGLAKGQVSQPVMLPGNKLALAVVTGVTAPRPKTFEEAADDIRSAMVQTRLNTAVQKHAQALYDKAKEMNGDLEKAAKSMGLEVKTSEEFTRSGSVKDLDNAAQFSAGFQLPDGSVYGPITLASGPVVVAKVIAHIAPNPADLAGQRSVIRDEIKKKKAEERNSLWEAGVVTELERQGKVKKNKDAIERLIMAYRA